MARGPFEHVVEQHGARVLRVCRAVLGVGTDADDAWSETFLAALQAWPELPEDTRIEAWLARVAHHKSVDVIRARVRRTQAADVLGAQRERAHDPRSETLGLWDEVARLPERQRLAIALHYFGGLTHVETAELIGASAEAVRKAASDGIKALRASQREHEKGTP